MIFIFRDNQIFLKLIYQIIIKGLKIKENVQFELYIQLFCIRKAQNAPNVQINDETASIIQNLNQIV
jgi:hypothetical protein